MLGSKAIVLVGMIAVFIAVLFAEASPHQLAERATFTLDDLFTNPKDLFNRSWTAFNPRPVPMPVPCSNFDCCGDNVTDCSECAGFDCTTGQPIHYRRFIVTGATYTGQQKNTGASVTLTTNLIVDFYIPDPFDTADDEQPVLVFRDPSAERSLRSIATNLSLAGIPVVLFREEPDEIGTDCSHLQANTLATKLGYAGEGDLLRESSQWIISQYKTNGGVWKKSILRKDYRYALAQMHILSFTALKSYLTSSPPPLGVPIDGDRLRVVYGGSSKHGSAALSAAGADSRALGLYIDGSSIMDAGDTGILARYRTDWRYCPYPPFPDMRKHPNADFAAFVLQTRNDRNSYAKIYMPSHLAPGDTRYQDLLILDVIGTHDHINPLASNMDFWRDHDGLGAAKNCTKKRWNFRLLRRINQDHGTKYLTPYGLNVADCSGAMPYPLPAREPLLTQALKYLDDPALVELPRIDLVDGNFTGTSTCRNAGRCWCVKVRISQTALRDASTPGTSEDRIDFKLHLMFGDDRDFRRTDGIFIPAEVGTETTCPCGLLCSPGQPGVVAGHPLHGTGTCNRIIEENFTSGFLPVDEGPPTDCSIDHEYSCELPTDAHPKVDPFFPDSACQTCSTPGCADVEDFFITLSEDDVLTVDDLGKKPLCGTRSIEYRLCAPIPQEYLDFTSVSGGIEPTIVAIVEAKFLIDESDPRQHVVLSTVPLFHHERPAYICPLQVR